MTLKKLSTKIQLLLNASAKIRSYTKAVEELVYNSLDASATSIAIRIDIQESFIQVVDNGFGISECDIPLLGQRYTSSKITEASELKRTTNYYGFRGESLSNIIESSKSVKITTRYKEVKETWIKCFYKGHHQDSHITSTRPSKGTTVEIKGFLYNQPIKKKATKMLNELENIKSFLKQLSLANTNVSISFRDNCRNDIIFKINKNRDMYQTLSSLFEINKEELQELQIEKNEYKAKGYIGKLNGEISTYRWIYLNGRFVYKSLLHDVINYNFMTNNKLYDNIRVKNFIYDIEKKMQSNVVVTPPYFIFISCPNFDYDINFISIKTIIEFKDWTQIYLLLEKLVKFYKGDIAIKEIDVKPLSIKNSHMREEVRKIMEKVLGNESKNKIKLQACKGIKGKIIKKKSKNKLSSKLKDSQKITRQKRQFKDLTLENNLCAIPKQTLSDEELMIKERKSLKNTPKLKNNADVEKKMAKNSKEIQTIQLKCYGSPIIKHRLKSLENRRQINNERKSDRKLKKVNKPTLKREKNKLVCNRDKRFVRDPRVLDKINGILRSRDLVKTILNSQIDNCLSKESSYCQRKYITPNYQCNKKITYVDNEQLNISACNVSFPRVTFESHNYNKENIASKSNYLNSDKFTTKNTKHNFNRGNIAESTYTKTLKNGIVNKYKSNYFLISNTDDKRHDFRENLESNVQYSVHQFSHTIEFTSTFNNIDYLQTLNNVNCSLIHSNTNNESSYKVPNKLQNTYTIVNSNQSLNISNYTGNQGSKNVTNGEYKRIKITSVEESLNSSNVINEFDNNEILPVNNISDENLKVIFISNSKNSGTITSIQPINLCEVNMDIEQDKSFNDNTINLLQNDKSQNGIHENLSSIINESGEISHQFRFKNMKSNTDNINYNWKSDKNNIESKDLNEDENVLQSRVLEITPNGMYKDQNVTDFKLKKRHYFLPKGMSPIFENCQTKNICSYNMEIDYFEDDLYHNFANNVLDNLKIYENGVTNLHDLGSEKISKDNSFLRFNVQSLLNAKVFGQVDKKFILAEIYSDSHNMKHLVLFDQHAVHERIRVERNLSDYVVGDHWTSVNCDKLILKLSKDNILYLNNFKDKFSQFGLQWAIENDCDVTITSIPKALIGKHCREADVILKSIKDLILEEIRAIKYLRGNTLLYPKSIMDLVFSEACRYAIKFGQKLSKSECATLINTLSQCKTPFQCAHGRPVMAVLLDLKEISNHYKVDKSKVLTFRNKCMK